MKLYDVVIKMKYFLTTLTLGSIRKVSGKFMVCLVNFGVDKCEHWRYFLIKYCFLWFFLP